MKPKIALAMIVKSADEEAVLLDKCLASIKGHVDGIFLNLNSTGKFSAKVRKVADKYTENVIETKWTGNFVQARTDNFAQVPEDYDFIMWLDADDIVENPEKIAEVCAIMDKKIDGLYIKYDYSHDDYGNVTVSHWVARVVRNNGSFAWKSSFADSEVTVHETLNEVRKVGKVMNDEFWITHNSNEDRMDASLERNIKILEGMLDKVPKGTAPDPRILFYLATHYVDANKLLQAKELFEYYLKLSGWAEERSQAWVYLGMVYDAYLDTDKARGCYMRALAENPKDPNPYVELGDLEIREKMFDKAVDWLDMAVAKKPILTSAVQRPMDSTYRAYKLLSQAHVNIGGKSLEKAQKWLTKAYKLRPFDPELKQAQELLDEIVETRDLTKATNKIISRLRDDKELDKIPLFCDSLPLMMQENPLVVSARNYYKKPKVWEDKSVVILCGWGPLGNWGPWSIEEGIGGSEEAVIQMSRELTKQGYKVTVLGTPGDKAGEYDGVTWGHYWEFNRKDTFDVFISWRNPELFAEPIKARKTYLWLHDVMDKEEFFDERLDNIDRIIFVSQYHRDLYPFIPEEKCFVSGNGIVAEDFDRDGEFKRDPHRIVYMSSHVRGLELIYNVWPEVRKAVPDATLDVYYGWASYGAVNRSNPERMAWKEKMIQMEQELDGVTDHGKIGHEQIVEEIFKAGVWAYPCPFPEVYCITAVKAQAGGAVPVSSNFAALDETVQFGTKLSMKAQDEKTPVGQWSDGELDEFKDALIDMLSHPEKQEEIRPAMMKWAREEMTWKSTATKWVKDFK
jgi:glycosyltransferase involved in cell wall biosynthesis